jgi:hypothetical protein
MNYPEQARRAFSLAVLTIAAAAILCIFAGFAAIEGCPLACIGCVCLALFFAVCSGVNVTDYRIARTKAAWRTPIKPESET